MPDHPGRRLAIVLAAALAACGSDPPATAPEESATPEAGRPTRAGIAVSDARVQLPVIPGRPGIAYFTVSQASGASRAIASVRVEGAGRAEIHATREVGGVTRMEKVEEVPVGAGQSVSFAPGGHHVMLFELAPALAAGTTTELTVTFDNGEEATTTAEVVAAGAAIGAAH